MSDKKPSTERVGAVPPFGLRMLPELRDRIAKAAKDNDRSMNAEIVTRLSDSFLDPNEAGYELSRLVDSFYFKIHEAISRHAANFPPSLETPEELKRRKT